MPKRRVSECFAEIMNHWNSPQKSNSICNLCPLWHHQSHPIFGVGNHTNPKVMAIAESPNEPKPGSGARYHLADRRVAIEKIMGYWIKAEESGIGSWIKMANSFDEIFSDLPKGKESVYLTNVWRCTNNGRSPDELQRSFEMCSHHLVREIRAIAPTVIVTFGSEALRHLVRTMESDPNSPPDFSIEEEVYTKPVFSEIEGKAITLSKLEFKILPAFHWSWGEFFSKPRWNGDYRSRMRKALRQALLDS